MNNTANRERFRETMRYRRRLLSNQRTHYYSKAARETRERGEPKRQTRRKMLRAERQIREFNSLATEIGLQPIRV